MGHFSFRHAKILIKCSLLSNFEMRGGKKFEDADTILGPKRLKNEIGQKWTKHENFTISINSN